MPERKKVVRSIHVLAPLDIKLMFNLHVVVEKSSTTTTEVPDYRYDYFKLDLERVVTLSIY